MTRHDGLAYHRAHAVAHAVLHRLTAAPDVQGLPMTPRKPGRGTAAMHTEKPTPTESTETDEYEGLAELLAGAEYDLIQAREAVTYGLLNEGGADQDDLDRLAETIEVMDQLRERAERATK